MPKTRNYRIFLEIDKNLLGVSSPPAPITTGGHMSVHNLFSCDSRSRDDDSIFNEEFLSHFMSDYRIAFLYNYSGELFNHRANE